MTPLICKCCGGKIDSVTMSCLYCDTVYLDESKQIDTQLVTEQSDETSADTSNGYRLIHDGVEVKSWVHNDVDIMTPNEVRKELGLNSLADFGISAEEATKNFLDLGHYGYNVKNEPPIIITEKPMKISMWDTFGRKLYDFMTVTCHHN